MERVWTRKLSCCRQTAQWIVSLNISLSHSRSWYHSKAWVRFPIRIHSRLTMALSCITSEIKWRPKIAIFHTLCIRRPRLGVPVQYCHNRFYWKTIEWCVLYAMLKKVDDTFSRFVYDRRTDRRISCDSTVKIGVFDHYLALFRKRHKIRPIADQQ